MTDWIRKPRPSSGPRDWGVMSGRERKDAIDTLRALAGHPALDDGAEAAPRAKPVAHEAAEQTALTRLALASWWAPGYWHIAQERHGREEARKLWRHGTRPGFPDVLVWIPAVDTGHPKHYRLPVRAVVELKRPDSRPKRDMPDHWWLDWRPEIDPLASEPTRHGLRWSQARALQLAHGVGYATMVAYGAEQAWRWLDALAGPRPAVLPEGWGR